MSMLDPCCPRRHSFDMSRYFRHVYAGTRARAEEKRQYRRLSRHAARAALNEGLADRSLLPEGLTLPDYVRSEAMAERLDWEISCARETMEYLPSFSRAYRKARLAEIEMTLSLSRDRAEAEVWSTFTKRPVSRAYRH